MTWSKGSLLALGFVLSPATRKKVATLSKVFSIEQTNQLSLSVIILSNSMHFSGQHVVCGGTW